MAIDYEAVEAAILGWLVSATGLDADSVLLANDKYPQPTMPYVTAKVPIPRNAGGLDEHRYSYDAAQPNGKQLTTTVVGQRETVVAVEAFTMGTVGRGSARELLSRAETCITLPSIQQALEAAGLAFVNVDGRGDFTAPLGPVGQGRATLDVRFRLVDTASEQGTFIESVPTPTAVWS
jgi:hypothetical protein